MTQDKPFLRVYPNPFVVRDKHGVPCGVCPRDPEKDAGGPLQFVGARLDRKRTRVIQELARGDDLRSPLQDTMYEFMGISADDPDLRAKLFALEPIEIPDTRYYRERLRERVLIAESDVLAWRKQQSAAALAAIEEAKTMEAAKAADAIGEGLRALSLAAVAPEAAAVAVAVAEPIVAEPIASEPTEPELAPAAVEPPADELPRKKRNLRGDS